MSIKVLPSNAVRALGSSQVLTDSCSLVKELIENSLDANASSVFVEVSENALDVIQVRDNGSGIAPDDRKLVCKRHCTSKIKNLSDLAQIGGSSLGFRGEALASAAEMSGVLNISTRVDGEAVAVGLFMSRTGEIETETLISHPVGTSVRISNYLKHMPVRRQTAIKSSARTSSKIKRLLQAYALARPTVRFSFKVLKARNEKANWSYAPQAGATVTDAALRVVDQSTVFQCQWRVFSSSNVAGIAPESPPTAADQSSGEGKYMIESLIPNHHCDLNAINNRHQYISIDYRPVSSVRGTLKDIVDLYKSYLRSSCTTKDSESLTDPFLFMNIRCPLGSYDINIEPSKDDVLFSEPGKVLEVVRAFFQEIYGELKLSDMANQEPSKLPKLKQPAFEVMLAHRLPITESPPTKILELIDHEASIHANIFSPKILLPRGIHPFNTAIEGSGSELKQPIQSHGSRSTSRENRDGDEVVLKEVSSSERCSWYRSMYNDSDEFLEDTDDPTPFRDQISDDEMIRRDANDSNPWTFAKMNAPLRRPCPRPTEDCVSHSNGQLMTPARQRGEQLNSDAGFQANVSASLNDACNSFANPPQEAVESSTSPQEDCSSPFKFQYPRKAWGKIRQNNRQDNHDSNRVRRGDRSPESFGDGNSKTFDREPGQKLLTDFVSARNLPIETLQNDAIANPQRQRRTPGTRKTSPQQPQQAPVNDLQRVWFDTIPSNHPFKPLTQAKKTENRPAQSTLAPDILNINMRNVNTFSALDDSDPSEIAIQGHPDLATSLDYEVRKSQATQRYREKLRQQNRLQALLDRKNGVKVRGLAQAQNDDEVEVLPSSSPSPHSNRYNAAVAALRPRLASRSGEDSTISNLTFPCELLDEKDPRAYLMRAIENQEQNNSVGNRSKQRRRTTSMLPLESIAPNLDVHDLVLTMKTSNEEVVKLAEDLQDWDTYIQQSEYPHGDGVVGLPTTEAQARDAEKKLRGLMMRAFESLAGRSRSGEEDLDLATVEFDIWRSLRDRSADLARV